MSTTEIIQRLDKHYRRVIESCPEIDDETIAFFNKDRLGGFAAVMFVPHTENYRPMLDLLLPDDIVCDMGAGDLRFALMAANKVKKIYAVEFNPVTLGDALAIIAFQKPRHLIAICCDWRRVLIPSDVTVITCMVNSAEIPIDLWTKNRRLLMGVTDGKGGKIVEFGPDINFPRVEIVA